MSTIEFALVRFAAITAAEQAFADAQDRSAPDAPWIRQVGLVEHHHNGHWVLRGTFAGHYVDVDEALHVSERGGAEGFAAGAALGALLGPPGLAAGMVLGAIIGSQTAEPNERDPEPRLLDEDLRNRLPRAGSAIALIGPTADVDDMLAAIGKTDGTILRQPLSASDLDSLDADLRRVPEASRGPSVGGQQAGDASAGHGADRTP
jgi:uncharacterized membrane protein